MRAKIATNLLWMLTERGLAIAVGIGVVAMLARALGPEAFAHFQYAQAIVLIASSATLICGSEIIVPRLVAMQTPADQHRLITHAAILRLGGALIGYLLICVFLLIKRPNFDSWSAALLLGIPILCREPAGIVSAWMQSATHNRPSSIINLIALALRLGIVAALFVFDVSIVPAFAIAFAVEAITAGVMLVLYYGKRMPLPWPRIDWTLMRELFASGALLWISFAFMMIIRRFDQLILESAVAAVDFGAYAACMQIADNFSLVASVVVAGIAPTMVYGKRQLADARHNVTRLAIGMGALGVCGAIAIALTASWIVQFLYGHAFAATIDLLRLAAFASSLLFIDVALSALLAHMRRPYWFAAKWGLVLVVTVIADLILIPRFGTLGGVAGYAISNFAALLCSATVWRLAGRQPAGQSQRAAT